MLARIFYNALVRSSSVRKEAVSTCMDPRISGEMLNSIVPGRFIIRNAGAMVQAPGVDATNDDNVKITLEAGFERFIIIGHSDCAAGRLAKPENGIVQNPTLISAWKSYSNGRDLKIDHQDHAHHTDGAVKKGVALSLDNLAKHGWDSSLTGGIFFDVENGQVEIFDKENEKFLNAENMSSMSVKELMSISNLGVDIIDSIKMWNSLHKIKTTFSAIAG